MTSGIMRLFINRRINIRANADHTAMKLCKKYEHDINVRVMYNQTTIQDTKNGYR